MKRILVITVIISFALVGVLASANYIYTQIEWKRTKKILAERERIEKQIIDLFNPTFNNTTFILKGDRYNFELKTVELKLDDNLLSKLEYIVNVYFRVYRNDEYYVSSVPGSWFLSAVKRDTLNSNFYRYNPYIIQQKKVNQCLIMQSYLNVL